MLAAPKQLIEKYGIKEWTEHLADDAGFGGNLFKVTVWDHKGNLQLTRNESFWGTKPKLRQINFKIYKDADTSYNSYLNGQVDVGVAGLPPTATYQQMKTRSDFHQIENLATSYLGRTGRRRRSMIWRPGRRSRWPSTATRSMPWPMALASPPSISCRRASRATTPT